GDSVCDGSFLLVIRRRLRSTLFPYTTLFRSGQLGGAPATEGQVLNATVTAQSLLQTPEQFKNIFLRNSSDGAQVRLGDVARVELDRKSTRLNSSHVKISYAVFCLKKKIYNTR